MKTYTLGISQPSNFFEFFIKDIVNDGTASKIY